MRLIRWINDLAGIEPRGYVLKVADGKRHNVIRGDLIPMSTKVIVMDGISFVDTGEDDPNYSNGYRVYREGFETFEYESHGE